MKPKTRDKRALAAALKKHRVRFAGRTNGLPGSPDFLVTTSNGRPLAVFLLSWAYSPHYHRHESQQRKLRRVGFYTLSVWSYELRADVDRVAMRIKRRAER